MEHVKLQRIVFEVFGGCNYTCSMCPQSYPGRGKNFTKKMRIEDFEKILDKIVPKYGKPIIAKDPIHIIEPVNGIFLNRPPIFRISCS